MDGYVLAGGFSRRMGADKARLPWLGPEPLAVSMARRLGALCSRVTVVRRQVSDGLPWPGVRVIRDAAPADEAHPLYGLAAALKDGCSQRVLVCPTDAVGLTETAMAKLEGKIRELEAELASTQSRTGEAAKAFQRAERKAKELSFAQGEDKKNQDRMAELASKLQQKIKTYKKQIEEAEEIAALNLAKFRKVAGVLGDASAAADAAEQVNIFTEFYSL